MAISIERYVKVTSGKGGGASTPTRDLIARIFTENSEAPTDTILEFDNADSVIDYFGAGSDEALRATYYFGFISKAVTSPKLISFARWANTDVGASILGESSDKLLSSFTAINAGGFTITLAGVDGVVASVDMSGAADFNSVATIMQSSIRNAGGSFSQVTVSFNASRKRFEFQSGNSGDESITVADGAQSPLLAMGWLGNNARISNGKDAQDTVSLLSETTDESNNFGSFLFNSALTQEQYVANANWNQSQNIKFIQMLPVSTANSQSMSDALIGIAGNCMVLNKVSGQYPEMLPSAILAATDYTAVNSTVNYMFHEDNRLTPSVTTNSDANYYDKLRVNYMGQTQTAGSYLAFFQRGILTGGSQFPIDINKYANEMWLKDFNTSGFMNLLRNLGKISRNSEGKAQGQSVIQVGVEAALRNGTISVGGVLDNTARQFIQSQTGDPNAYLQVQNAGYWYNVEFRTDTESDGSTTEVLVYTLIYNDDDTIKMVDGRHILV